MKIGKLVQKYIPKIFAYCEKNPHELNNLLNKDYSKQNFGINFPFCLEAEIITAEQSRRYWTNRYDVCGKAIRVTSQWWDHNRYQFMKYLLEKGIVNEEEYKKITSTQEEGSSLKEKKGIVNREEVKKNTSNDGDESGLEIEQEDPTEKITEPFDPEQIKINTRSLLAEQLVSRIKYKEIDLTPEFQRLRGIWNDERKSRLIESLLLKIPIPVFYVAADRSDSWSVVDGVQRMSTIDDYVTGRFVLTRLEYLTWLDGYNYDVLPRLLQRRINETELIVNVIEPGTPPEVMLNVFLRINTGGMTLNGQEIRHALNPGPVREYLKALAQSPEFKKATHYSIKEIRMADRECVLRFLAFHIEPPEKYTTNDLDGYLGKVMERINRMSPAERHGLTADFKKAMCAASNIFGEYAFRKRTNIDDRRRPVSKALFESWSVQLARCLPEQIRILVKKREAVQRRFIQLVLEDEEFNNAISYSTSTPRRVQKRFQAIKQLVEEFI